MGAGNVAEALHERGHSETEPQRHEHHVMLDVIEIVTEQGGATPEQNVEHCSETLGNHGAPELDGSNLDLHHHVGHLAQSELPVVAAGLGRVVTPAVHVHVRRRHGRQIYNPI